jgi:hypothetical protein
VVPAFIHQESALPGLFDQFTLKGAASKSDRGFTGDQIP